MIAKMQPHGNQKPKGVQSILLVLVFVLVFGGVIGLLTYQNIKIRQKRADLQEKLEVLQVQAGDLVAQKSNLEEELEVIENDEHREKLLREQGLYKKPGEEVVTILSPEESQELESDIEEVRGVWWNPLTWF